MRAIVQDGYGEPEQVLRLTEVPVPSLANDEVLVRVRAASVHPDVWHVALGVPYALRLMGGGLRRPGHPIPGTDVAGVVAEVGSRVTRFRVGDEVFGETRREHQWVNGGAFAEFVAIPEDVVERKPARLSFEQAAAVPSSGYIALQGLLPEGRLQAGQRVLVNGAAGGVGHLAVQIAKALGASHVAAVDLPGKLDVLRTIGADRVIDATVEDFTSLGERYDIILDVASSRTYSECRRALTPSGTYVLIGHDQFGSGRVGRWMGSLRVFLPLLVRSAFDPQLPGLRGAKGVPGALQLLARFIDEGKLTPVVDRAFPLARTVDAIRRLTSGGASGKVVVTMQE